MTKCNICKKRKGTLTFAESVMDFVHGFKQKICKQCYKEILIERRNKINAMLEKLEKGELKNET